MTLLESGADILRPAPPGQRERRARGPRRPDERSLSDGPQRTPDLQAAAPDQLQGVRVPDLPRLRHEAGAEGHRARQVPLRERRGQDGAGRRVGAAHQARHRSAPATAPSRSATRRCCSGTRRPSSTSRASSCASRATTRELAEVAARVGAYGVERVGMTLTLDGLAVEHAGGDAAAYAAAVAAARAAAARPAAGAHERRRGGDRRGPGRRRRRRQAARPRRHRGELAGDGRGRQEARLPAGHPQPRTATSTALAELSEQVRGAGVEDLVLDPGTTTPRRRPRRVHAAAPPGAQEGRAGARLSPRRLRRRRRRGRPSWCAPRRRSPSTPASSSSTTSSPAVLYSLLTLRQNIYTDPQKPIQMEPKLYEIGAVTAGQPGAHHDQLLAHLLLGGGRGRGRRHPHVAAGRRQRRPVGAHRLGGRQVRRREDRQDGQGLRHRAEGRATRSWSSPATSPGSRARSRRSCPSWQIMVGPRDAVDIPNYIKNVWSA